MKTKTLKVNGLPVRTWHWLGMNDSELNIEMPVEVPWVELRGGTGDLKLRAGSCGAAIGTGCPAAERMTVWQEIETGMGDEFDGYFDDAKSFLLDIPDGYKAGGEPAVISVETPCGSTAGQILIRAGRNSEVSVVIAIRRGKAKLDGEEDAGSGTSDDEGERAASAGESGGTVAIQLKFFAEEGALLKLYVAQTLPERGLSCLNIGGVCRDKARVELTEISLGSLSEYAGIAARLQGEGSSFSTDMGYRVKTSQRLDINYIVRHIGRDSSSTMNARGVLEDGSVKLFRGTIDFAEGCTGSKGQEKEEVMLLGEHQVNQTIPIILCHEEDVEGDHGATISRLDEQTLFYLESRGIDPQTAENIAARARVEALINRIPDEEVRFETNEML